MIKNNNTVVIEKVTDPVYTYIGAGETSPQVINFMGLKVFRIGMPELVSFGSVVHKKIQGNPAFKEGEVSIVEITANETKEKKEVAEKKAADRKLNEEVKRKYRAEA